MAEDYFGIGIDTKKLEQDAQRAKQAFDSIGNEAVRQSAIIDKAFDEQTLSKNFEKELSNISKLSIDAFNGISDNAQRMMREIQEDTLTLGNIEKVMSQLNAAYEKGSISQQDYINAAARMEVLHENISRAIQNNEKALRQEMSAVDKLADDSMVVLQQRITTLTTEYMRLSEAQRNSAQGEGLLKNISEIQTKLSSAQVAMNKYGAAATGQFNMLNVSIQQIARELPSLTISPQMFFLAISNNLPIFTDALVRARQEFKAMTAAGKEAVPVWKQVAKSLLSWQTALSLLPALLIVYSDEISEFFSSMLSGSKKVDMAAESIKTFNETMKKGEQDAQEELVNLNLLYDATQNVSKSMEERKRAVDELQKIYPNYFSNMTDEEILAGKAADAYQRLSTSILSAAKAQAARDRIVEEQKNVIDYEQKVAEAQAKLEPLQKKLNEAQRNLNTARSAALLSTQSLSTTGTRQLSQSMNVGVQAAQSERDKFQKEVDALNEEITGYQEIIDKSNTISKQLEESINVIDLTADPQAKEKTKKKQTKYTEQLFEELLRLQEENEDRKIEAMRDGTDKELAQIELNYSRKINEVKKLEADLAKAQGGALKPEQTAVFQTAYTGIEAAKTAESNAVLQKQAEAERKAMQDYLIQYGDYWKKRENIAAQYQDRINKATTKGETMALEAKMTETLAKLDDEAQKKTSIVTKLFGNMATKSVAEMRKIADEAEQFLSFIEGGEYDKNNAFGITEAQFKILSQSPEKLESIKNEIANVRAEADKLEPVFTRIKSTLIEIFKGSTKNQTLTQQLQQLNSDVSKVMQSVQFLSNAFSSLGDTFGSDALTGVADGLNAAMSAVNSAMQGAQAGSLFGPIGASAGAAIGVVTSLASSIAKIHDKKNERQIEELQNQIDILTSSYDNLGRAVEEAYSKDASNLIEQQNKLLEQQKVLIQQQIAEEQDKKKTDNDRIKQWQQQIDDINQQIEDNKEAAVDAIFGSDVQTAIEDFSSAMTDAWANGTNASQSARNVVKQMMQEMVTESVKAAIKASGSMEEIRKKLQEFYADNVLTGWEQDYIYNMADKLQDQINEQFGWAQGLFESEKTTTSGQKASAGGFATASQDSVDELSGRFTAIYEVQLRQEQQINTGVANLESMRASMNETRDMVQSCYGELVEIKENTAAIIKPIQQMQKDIAEVKNNTSRI